MKHTEKTSGEQIKKMLTMLKEDEFISLRVEYDNDNIGIRVENLPSIGEIVEVLDICEINPMFVVIDNRWGHLTIWFCNYDGTDIYIED